MSQSGYLLPSVIILGLAIGTVSIMALKTVAQSSLTLNNQSYSIIAKEAAQAGVSAAIACVKSNNGVRTWGMNAGTAVPLTPKGCPPPTGPAPTGNDYITNITDYTATYSVAPIEDINSVSGTSSIITSTGTVYVKGPGSSKAIVATQTVRTQVKTSGLVTTTNPSTNKKVVQISAGPSTVCAVTDDDSINDHWVYCWGSDSNLQLGVYPKVSTSKVPVAVYSGAAPATPATPMAGKHVVKVSVGTNHTCAIAQDGTDDTTRRAYCWGQNDNGQLGITTKADSTVPVAVYTDGAITRVCTHKTWGICDGWNVPDDIAPSGLRNSDGSPKTVVDITAGNESTCALTSDGSVSCWGLNDNGQLGNGTRDTAYAPVATALTGIAKLGIVKNAYTICATSTSGGGVCWGQNYAGQIGDGQQYPPRESKYGGCQGITPKIPATKDHDALHPTSVQLWRPLTSITTISEDSNSSYTTAKTTDTNQMYWWGGSTDSNTTSIICGTKHGGGQGGGGVNKRGYTTTRTYDAQPRPTGALSETGQGSPAGSAPLGLVSGNAYNGLFCATTGGSIYCDGHGRNNTKSGETGNGTIVKCNIIGCSPNGFTTPQQVSTYTGGTAPADTGSIHGSDLSANMALSVTDMDTGMSGYTCIIANTAVLCWGQNASGQIGNNSTGDRFAPTLVDTSKTQALGKAGGVSGGTPVGTSIATIGSSNGPIDANSAKSF